MEKPVEPIMGPPSPSATAAYAARNRYRRRMSPPTAASAARSRSINRGFIRGLPLKIGVLTKTIILMVTTSVNRYCEVVFFNRIG